MGQLVYVIDPEVSAKLHTVPGDWAEVPADEAAYLIAQGYAYGAGATMMPAPYWRNPQGKWPYVAFADSVPPARETQQATRHPRYHREP